jgi:23S rRNA pseudouridine2605 synthase
LSERVQKVLAAAGVCSRREAEQWIVAGRVAINARLAKLGDRVVESDQIKVDGRVLRLERQAPLHLVVLYHRAPGEPLKRTADMPLEMRSVMERLPTVRSRRWLPLAPLSPSDGGLEVFSTDGQLRAAFSRQASRLSSRYALRLSGDWLNINVEALLADVTAAVPELQLSQWSVAESEGRNRWLECTMIGGHGKDLRAQFTAMGFEVSRILRLQLAGLQLERSLSRHRLHELKGGERARFYHSLGLEAPLSTQVIERREATSSGKARSSGRRSLRETPTSKRRS